MIANRVYPNTREDFGERLDAFVSYLLDNTKPVPLFTDAEKEVIENLLNPQPLPEPPTPEYCETCRAFNFLHLASEHGTNKEWIERGASYAQRLNQTAYSNAAQHEYWGMTKEEFDESINRPGEWLYDQVSWRGIDALVAAGYDTVGKIAAASDKELMAVKYIGARSVLRIRQILPLPA